MNDDEDCVEAIYHGDEGLTQLTDDDLTQRQQHAHSQYAPVHPHTYNCKHIRTRRVNLDFKYTVETDSAVV